jgi:hypothetical protein
MISCLATGSGTVLHMASCPIPCSGRVPLQVFHSCYSGWPSATIIHVHCCSRVRVGARVTAGNCALAEFHLSSSVPSTGSVSPFSFPYHRNIRRKSSRNLSANIAHSPSDNTDDHFAIVILSHTPAAHANCPQVPRKLYDLF